MHSNVLLNFSLEHGFSHSTIAPWQQTDFSPQIYDFCIDQETDPHLKRHVFQDLFIYFIIIYQPKY